MENRPQLQMLWPEALLSGVPEPSLAPEYVLRIFDPDQDLADYLSLVHEAGFTDFDEQRVTGCLQRVLPDGFFVAVHMPTDELVATAMATHNPTRLHAYGGELGWVAGRSAHAGNGLGTAVCAAVVRRFLSAGYRRIYLLTDDWRLPALKVYLKLGFVPYLFEAGIAPRWQTICESLHWPYTPESWPGVQGN
ncbi:MAG: GNAT family N-acetyltransferase [Anaerolineae bacterium]|jgi:mycothiol synthase|nr:GNAT family N-acetyltransferase [Anaerolineae bacterium]